MDQTKFIYIMQKSHPLDIRDDGKGNVTVQLRNIVFITHSYKKNNHMEIMFSGNTPATYVIPSQDELKYIISLHHNSMEFIGLARAYCDKHLQKIQ